MQTSKDPNQQLNAALCTACSEYIPFIQRLETKFLTATVADEWSREKALYGYLNPGASI